MTGPIRAAVCLAVGVGIMAACAAIEQRASQGSWRTAYPFLGPMPDWPEAIPLRAVDLVANSETWATERVLFIDFEPDEWESLTAAGEVPTPGEREALAGVLCREETFDVAGVTYTVTGRMPRDAAGLSMAYVVPFEDADKIDAEAVEAGIEDGFFMRQVERGGLNEERAREFSEDVQPLVVHDGVPMVAGLPILMLAAMALVLYGSAALQWSALSLLRQKTGAFASLFDAAGDHPAIFRNMLQINYGAFLAAMLIGVLTPRANLAVSQWVFEMFSEGGLKELGAAYMDGNIPLAAWRTFQNNFVLQSLIMAAIPSLLIPLWGVGKTLLSLTVVGFAMAPAWSSGTWQLTFHWITIVIELQAYILVSFGICVYTKQTFEAIRLGLRGTGDEEISPVGEFGRGINVLTSATVYAFFALAIAAVYEAVTLILIG
jgi:hypothetical protein